jgi:hypothetical protein
VAGPACAKLVNASGEGGRPCRCGRKRTPLLPPLDPLIIEAAAGKRELTIDSAARLIVFGFDADQKKGQLQTILKSLRQADPNLAIYAVGDPASAGGAFRPLSTQKA